MTSGRPARAAVAVGVFDGVHLGHRDILARALALAGGLGTAVVSFDPHPDVVLAKRFEPVAPLTPLPERRERILAMGIDEVVIVPFTRELAALSPEAFVDEYLVGPFRLRALVVGERFALGRGRSGDVPRLRALGAERGFTVEPVPLREDPGVPISSTRIRDALSAGRVGDAARLLGRRYGLEGHVVTGEGIGRTLGYPTANLRLDDEKFVPAHGIYAVWVRVEGDPVWRMGAMSIGVRPTFGGQTLTLEVFVLDWSGELPGRRLEVQFVEWLRPELRFESRDALIQAMNRDVTRTREVLAATVAG